jgi:uncharacterized damage-inducible protein DinB
MFRLVEDFLEGWKYEGEATLKVFRYLTKESLQQKVTPEGRSIGFLAWHITQSIGEMMSRTGLEFSGYEEKAPVPAGVDKIVQVYESFSQQLMEQIRTKWQDADLAVELNMYGQMWKKGKALAALIAHQAHHRAQITVLMRQAGLKVPGVYGPSREEWAAFGMPAEE